MMLALDTHIVVWSLAGGLTVRERRAIGSSRCGISAIVLWELAMLVRRRRATLALDDPTVVSALATLHVWPLDLDVARASAALDFRSDPADEIIAATSVVHRVPLLTRDRRIRASKLVPLA